MQHYVMKVPHTTSISIFYVGQYLTHWFGLSFSYLDYVSFLRVPVDVTIEVFLSQSSNAESKY